MSDPVYFVDPALVASAAIDDVITVRGPEARHAVSVARVRVDDTVDLVDGLGRRVRAVVQSVDEGDSLTARVWEVVDEPVPSPRIVVVQAIPKGDHGDLAVDLLTQAGVDEIIPWAAQHCVAIWRGDKAQKSRDKWQSAAERAAKQSRRARVPRIQALASTKDVIECIREATTALVLHESADCPLASVPLPESGDILIVVGPEGGISVEERAAFSAAGATLVLLGPQVLRSSFAGAAAIVAVASRGRWAAWDDAHHE